MREIKFRGYSTSTGNWVYGGIDLPDEEPSRAYIIEKNKDGLSFDVDRETVGQFTGLLDKNSKEIYEGDIIKYYTISNYVQQSFAECRPEIEDWYVHSINEVVVFDQGIFVLGKVDEYNHTIDNTGLYELDWVIEQCCIEQNDDGSWSDCDGNYINESILGIEIIGNIHDNSDLINK